LTRVLPDWDQVYRVLAIGRTRLRLWEIDALTEVEAAFLLDQDLEKQRPPMGARSMSPEEIQEYATWRRSLTWLQKLKIAVEDW